MSSAPQATGRLRPPGVQAQRRTLNPCEPRAPAACRRPRRVRGPRRVTANPCGPALCHQAASDTTALDGESARDEAFVTRLVEPFKGSRVRPGSLPGGRASQPPRLPRGEFSLGDVSRRPSQLSHAANPSDVIVICLHVDQLCRFIYF